jgi:tripartite-type tricarboxylate transporter receptor subunit TctC
MLMTPTSRMGTGRLRGWLVLVAGLTIASAVQAQEAWPSKPVRFIVPFPAGGSTDVLARVYGDALGRALGQRVVIENKAGAAGNLGVEAIARAAPDGYTIGISTIGPMSAHVALYPQLPFDPRADFTHLAEIYEIPNVFVVHPNNPAKTLAEFVAWAKTRPQVTFGTPGNGTTGHLGTELFARRADLKLTHVPYRTGAVAVQDLIGERIDMMFENLPTIIGQIQGGQIRPLAVSTARRWPGLPDVPTIMEAGIADFAVTSWSVIIGPKGLPQAIAERVTAETMKITADPAFTERFAQMGAVTVTGGPDSVRRRMESEIPRWAEVVRASGAKVE